MLILLDFDETLTIHSTCCPSQNFWPPITFQYRYNKTDEISTNINHADQAKSALLQCKQRGDIICIVSNNPSKELIEQYLFSLLGINWKNIISAIRNGSGHLKDKCNDADELAKQHNLPPSDIILVDDNWNQCQAAMNAGMGCIHANSDGTHWSRLISKQINKKIDIPTSNFTIKSNPLLQRRKTLSVSQVNPSEPVNNAGNNTVFQRKKACSVSHPPEPMKNDQYNEPKMK